MVNVNEGKKYFLAATKSTDEECDYDIYLVNDSEDIIQELMMTTVGFATEDDDLVSTSTVKRKFENIGPKSYVFIESLTEYDLDFMTQYSFTIVTDSGVEKIGFTIGKDIGFMGNYLPVLNKMGKRWY